MSKYNLLYEQLLYEGTCTPENFFEPGTPNEEAVLKVHTKAYVNNLKNLTLDARAARKTGFPLSEALVKREFLITQGTIEGAQFALKNRIAMNIAGGTHHAYTDHGEGFCLFNDQAVAAQYLLDKNLASKILIVDLDVHQGNGTAEIFQENNSVFTFSMHGKNNYPFKKEKSDLDIELVDGTADSEYLKILKETLPKLIADVKPDFIFYLSGVDILESDKLGRLNCTIAGCKERDRYVLETVKEQHLPIQISMGGGYSKEIKIIIEAHANTYRLAQQLFF